MTTQEKDTRAKDQAKAQLESIVDMVKRLKHCQDCDGEECELTDREIYAGINLSYKEGDQATEEERQEYHNEEAARQSIQEDPLSVQIRGGWHNPGEKDEAMEYEILLCTGGPACRIMGELGEHNEPDTAVIEYQDWFTPWETYHNTNGDEDTALLFYARQFYFEEC